MIHKPTHDKGELDFGSRLSAEEYERRIIGLYSGLPPMPSKMQEEDIRRQELNLKIDHRLGINFPQDRRAALWDIQCRVEKKRMRFAFKHLLRRHFAKLLTNDAQNLAGYLVDEYAKVLTQDELRAYFDLEEGKSPALPIDIEHLRK